MSSTTPENIPKDIQTLRILRASLQSVDIYTKELVKDLETMTKNYVTITEIYEGWKRVVEQGSGSAEKS
ncbi:11557_t:CDS:2 [Paraglomus brasilianum]|uniref:11557_t:CDS:1 n=1 Tax=Paraglomus brasilianum TaxID=144538 RepID=A0A9N8WNZ8_9GLOM|nr:11557_t:CDS:2 [Paraglomus brasilianum]